MTSRTAAAFDCRPESTRISPPDLTHINDLPCRPDIVAKFTGAPVSPAMAIWDRAAAGVMAAASLAFFHPAVERAAPRHGPKDLPRPCLRARCNRTAVPAVSSAAGKPQVCIFKSCGRRSGPRSGPMPPHHGREHWDFQGISMGWETRKPLPRPRFLLASIARFLYPMGSLGVRAAPAAILG